MNANHCARGRLLDIGSDTLNNMLEGCLGRPLTVDGAGSACKGGQVLQMGRASASAPPHVRWCIFRRIDARAARGPWPMARHTRARATSAVNLRCHAWLTLLATLVPEARLACLVKRSSSMMTYLRVLATHARRGPGHPKMGMIHKMEAPPLTKTSTIRIVSQTPPPPALATRAAEGWLAPND